MFILFSINNNLERNKKMKQFLKEIYYRSLFYFKNVSSVKSHFIFNKNEKTKEKSFQKEVKK